MIQPATIITINNYNPLPQPYIKQKNYNVFNETKVDVFVKQKEHALPYIREVLLYSMNEEQILETLYTLNKMIDSGTKGVDKIYYALSRFNNTQSPAIQSYLAGIYRKIQVPDGFGPLVSMLIQNSLKPDMNINFNPNEEIGGAILSYISERFRQ